MEQPLLFISLAMVNNGSSTKLFAGVGLAVLHLGKCAATPSFPKTWNQWGFYEINPLGNDIGKKYPI